MDRKIFIYNMIAVALTLLYFGAILALGLGKITPVSPWHGLYSLAAVPIIEEYIFRVFIQGSICKKYNSLTFANTVTSVIFSLCHMFFYPPLTAVGVFFPSMILGYVYGKTASYFSVIFIHAVFNMNIFISYQSDILGKFF